MKRRVVITGLGAVTPLGNDVSTTWEALVAGHSGIGYITCFDASDMEVKIAAEVKGFEAVPDLVFDREADMPRGGGRRGRGGGRRGGGRGHHGGR